MDGYSCPRIHCQHPVLQLLGAGFVAAVGDANPAAPVPRLLQICQDGYIDFFILYFIMNRSILKYSLR